MSMTKTGAGYFHLPIYIFFTDFVQDVEMNREGKTGYLTVESKRRLKAEAQVSTLNCLIAALIVRIVFLV